MVYIVTQCIQHKPHHLSHAILLSPAGALSLAPVPYAVLGLLLSSEERAQTLGWA